MRENSITVATQNWIFRQSSLFQNNRIHRSNEKVNQTTCFKFAEMPGTLAEPEDLDPRADGRRTYNRAGDRVPDKSNSH